MKKEEEEEEEIRATGKYYFSLFRLANMKKLHILNNRRK